MHILTGFSFSSGALSEQLRLSHTAHIFAVEFFSHSGLKEQNRIAYVAIAK